MNRPIRLIALLAFVLAGASSDLFAVRVSRSGSSQRLPPARVSQPQSPIPSRRGPVGAVSAAVQAPGGALPGTRPNFPLIVIAGQGPALPISPSAVGNPAGLSFAAAPGSEHSSEGPGQGHEAPSGPGGSSELSRAWLRGAQGFDGQAAAGPGFGPIDPSLWGFRNPNHSERRKIEVSLQAAGARSPVFQELNSQFQREGGYFLIDNNRNARYLATATKNQWRNPVIVLTWDLLNRFNGRDEDVYRGAPWEFIASVMAREQMYFSDWYSSIPDSAEKLTIAFMNMVRVFVELTDGRSSSWATDKDYQGTPGDSKSHVAWNWFEQLLFAARAAVQGVGTNTGHIIESNIFAWARDSAAAEQKAGIPAFQFSLWEMQDGKYYRRGDAKNGQPLPSQAPRIDRATYDRESYKVYGADGKGSNNQGSLDAGTVFGWIIQWLKDRFEV